MTIENKDIYKELGENFRLTLRWREGLFAGFLVVIATLSLALYKLTSQTDTEPHKVTLATGVSIPLNEVAWVIPLIGAGLAIIFLLLDRRCHEVLIQNYQLGKRLEEDAKQENGFYAAALERGEHPKHITHTMVLESLYVSMGIGLLILALFILVGDANSKGGTSMFGFNQAALFVGFYWLLNLLPGLILSYLGYKLLSIDMPQKQENVDQSRVKRTFCPRAIAGGVIGAVGVGIIIWFLFWRMDLEHVKGLMPSSSQAIPKSLSK